MNQVVDRYEWARFLVAKLERLSADSVWAHRASGLRGALMRAVEEFDRSRTAPGLLSEDREDQSLEQIDRLIAAGFDILEKAAKEIPDPEEKQIGSDQAWIENS
jgi:hypothetical protein